MKKLLPDMILGFIGVLILLFSMTLKMKLYFWGQEMYQSSILNFFISGIPVECAAIMLFIAWAIKPRK